MNGDSSEGEERVSGVNKDGGVPSVKECDLPPSSCDDGAAGADSLLDVECDALSVDEDPPPPSCLVGVCLGCTVCALVPSGTFPLRPIGMCVHHRMVKWMRWQSAVE